MSVKNFLADLRRLANFKFKGSQENALIYLLDKSEYFLELIKDLLRFSNAGCWGNVRGALKYLNRKQKVKM